MAELKDFKAGQRVKSAGGALGDNAGVEGVVTFVFDHRAGMFDEVNVVWDGAITPMPTLVSSLEIIAGAITPENGADEE